MDKFENAVMMMSKMSARERMKMVEEKMGMCICPDCPTYLDCAKKARERLFCIHGDSFVCISQEVDCICPSCPVGADMGMSSNFFCTRGGEAAQRWTKGLMSRK
jgi:RNase P subunit RPR2